MLADSHSIFATAKVYLAIYFALDHLSLVLAQKGGVSNLPPCATNCATTAASAVGCTLLDTDASCLCEHPSFSSATIQCSHNTCTVEDRGVLQGILDTFCANTPPSPRSTGTTTSSSSSTSQTSRSPSSRSPHPFSQSFATSVSPTPPTESSASEPGPRTGAPTSSGTGPGTAIDTPGSAFSAGATDTGQTTSIVIETVTSPDASPTANSGALGKVEFRGNQGVLTLFVGWVFGISVIFV